MYLTSWHHQQFWGCSSSSSWQVIQKSAFWGSLVTGLLTVGFLQEIHVTNAEGDRCKNHKRLTLAALAHYFYYRSWGVNRSSLFNLFPVQNFMNWWNKRTCNRSSEQARREWVLCDFCIYLLLHVSRGFPAKPRLSTILSLVIPKKQTFGKNQGSSINIHDILK